MLNILKALTSSKWGKQKELIVSTFKAITHSILEYANIIYSPIVSNTKIKKLQIIQNTVLPIATGCTQDTNTQHLHNETKVLPIDTHLKLNAIQLKQLTQTQAHPLHDLNAYLSLPETRKPQSFITMSTNIIISESDITPEEWRKNIKHIDTTITSQYLRSRKSNKVTNTTLYDIYSSEQTVSCRMCTKLAQFRANKSPLLQSYLHTVNPETYATMPTMLVTHT